MRIKPDPEQVNQIKNIWQAICWRMNERKVTPAVLALKTGYSRDCIERGIRGEPEQISLGFLQRCIMVLGLRSARVKFLEDTPEILSWDECVGLLKPPPAAPPRQGNFWDYDD